MKYFKKLIGDDIYLSPMNLEDFEIYTKWLNDFKVTEGLGVNVLVNLIHKKDWTEKALKEMKMCFSVIKLEEDKLIGHCGLNEIDMIKRTAEVVLYIGEEENRNKGYGTQTLKLLLDYGFNYLNLKNIILSVYSFNEIAINTYTKIGFKEIGRRRESYFLNGKYYDEIFMDILSNEFKESYIKNKII